MEERNITITIDKAKEWYNSGNSALKEVALQAFDENKLITNFKNITTFRKACDALDINYNTISIIINRMIKFSKASTVMFKLNIIRNALNLGYDLHLTKDSEDPENSYIYYPYNPFVTEDSTYYKSELSSGKLEIIGKIKSEGTLYNVIGDKAIPTNYAGLGSFYYYPGVGHAYADVGFLGCANKEIAQHFGKYFGMLITEAKYGDLSDFEIIESKY